MVWPTLGSRTAKEQNITEQNSGLLPVQRMPVQRPLPSLTDTAVVTDTCGFNNSIDAAKERRIHMRRRPSTVSRPPPGVNK